MPGFEASAWVGIGAPRSTPADLIGKLNQEINAALAEPKMRMRFAELGGAGFIKSPAEMSKFVADETEKWGKVVRAANVKPE